MSSSASIPNSDSTFLSVRSCAAVGVGADAGLRQALRVCPAGVDGEREKERSEEEEEEVVEEREFRGG